MAARYASTARQEAAGLSFGLWWTLGVALAVPLVMLGLELLGAR